MMNAKLIQILGLALMMVSSSASAMSIDWTGLYRAEWTEVDRPSLGTPSDRKAYGLQFLYLSPKIIAADGINITTRFDIINYNNPAYVNSQLGDFWGFNSNSSAVVSKNQGPVALGVSQLYLTFNQEYGSLMIGRMPWEFGIGALFNSGKGQFDHWYNSRELIAYKIIMGDWFMTPMIGRQRTQDFGQGNTISTTGFQFQYENDENKSLIGFFMEQKKGSASALDYSASQITAFGGSNATVSSNLSQTTTSFVLGRGFDSFEFKFEADFLQGETGVVTSAGENVNLNGFGLAAEVNLPKSQSKWDWNLKLGFASGDDPNSSGYGGFSFDRNYNVAMLMFNHRLGKADFLQTNVNKDTANLNTGNSVDDESLSNAVYLAPSASYRIGDKLELRNTVVYAQLLNVQKSSVDAQKDLGFEWDIELVYKPSERIQWINQIGLFAPGAAWKNGTDSLNNEFTYGLESKAAISF
jgi:hypothetical protein